MKPIKIEIWNLFDLYYHRRLPAFRLWKRVLAWLAPAACVAWLCAAEWGGDRRPYSSGAMSPGHEFLAEQCQDCHTNPMQGFMPTAEKDRSMNTACLNCHQNSIGHDSVTMSAWHQWSGPGPSGEPGANLACSACHAEHNGPTRLVEIADSMCVQCHGDLNEWSSHSEFARRISSFANEHPDFEYRLAKDMLPKDVATARIGLIDPGRLKYPHDKHLRSGLPIRYDGREAGVESRASAERRRVQMKCYDCHRHGQSMQAWPYARFELHQGPGRATTETEPALQAAYMVPIRYSFHCAECHPLGGDPRFSGEDVQIPHRTPAEIRTFLWGELSRFFKANPRILDSRESWKQPSFVKSDEPKELSADQQAKLLDRVDDEVRAIEDRIYRHRNICQDCHYVTVPDSDPNGLPSIERPNVAERWLGSASFTHEKHRVLDCAECHATAAASKESGDVLMPGIALCRRCHGTSGDTRAGQAAGVSDRCVYCHTYHRPIGEGFPRVGKSLSELTANRP